MPSIFFRALKRVLSCGLVAASFLLASCLTSTTTDNGGGAGGASPPQAMVAVPGNGKITVVWRKSYDTTVTKYEAAATPDSIGLAATISATTKNCVTATAGDSVCTISGLTNGVAYHVGVRAYNSRAGDWRQVYPVLPTGLPNAPVQAAAYAGNGFAQVAWSAAWVAQGDGAVTGYVATSVEDPSRSCSTGGDSTCDVTGLTNGAAYTFTVTTLRSGVSSAASAPTLAVTPGVNTVPSPPRNVVLINAGYGPTQGQGPQAVVSWSAPRILGGSALQGYVVTAVSSDTSVAPVTRTVSADSTQIVLLVNRGGDYTLSVKAANATGTGAATPQYFAFTGKATTPFAPSNVTVATDTGFVTVSWAAPFSGGAFITGYAVMVDGAPGLGCVTTSVTSCRVGGLDNNRSYTFLVTATNSAGTGLAGASALTAMPTLSPPGAPTNVTAVAVGINLVTVSWTPPVSTGGSRILGYLAYAVEDTNRTCTSTGGGPLVLTVSCDINALGTGIPFTFKVKAINAVGTGPASAASPSATPIGILNPPGAPTGLTGGPVSPGVAVFYWSPPASRGGSFITGYQVTEVSDTSKHCSADGNTPTCTIAGLSIAHTYLFQVRAFNSSGGGSNSSPFSLFLTAAPDAPSGVTAYQSGPNQATVLWSDGFNGGDPIIDDIAVAVEDTTLSCGGHDGLCIIYNLAQGRTYTFKVVSDNHTGPSPYSAPSAPLQILSN